jgi:oxidoreductase, short chain dehydrogenase/reductase family
MTNSFNPFSLEGKKIIITGASSGIGRQCAIDCAKIGAKVVVIGRNESRLEETFSNLVGNGHLSINYDLTNFSQLSALIEGINAKIGKVDGVVNCAGISTTLPYKLLSTEKLEEFFKVNVFSAVELTREVIKNKYMNPNGSVIFLSSIMGIVGDSGKALYSMTKGALISACRSLASEYAKRGIRFNCISPGAILTPINEHLPHMSDPEKRAILESKHPLGLGTTTDVSNACIYLLSDAARWITGQNLVVDGGYTAR